MHRAFFVLCTLVTMSTAPPEVGAATTINKCGTTINKSGAYKLTKNLTLKSGQFACITVNANLVTIDLGGYTIDCGDAAGNNAGIIDAIGASEGVSVRDGHVTRCANAIDFAATGILVEGLTLNSDGNGLLFTSAGNRVTGSIANDNSSTSQGWGMNVQCPSAVIDDTTLNNLIPNIIVAGPPLCGTLNDLPAL